MKLKKTTHIRLEVFRCLLNKNERLIKKKQHILEDVASCLEENYNLNFSERDIINAINWLKDRKIIRRVSIFEDMRIASFHIAKNETLDTLEERIIELSVRRYTRNDFYGKTSQKESFILAN